MPVASCGIFDRHSVNIFKGPRRISVLEMLHAFEQAAGRSIPYRVLPRQPGDAAESVARADLAWELLGWRAEHDLSDMCRDAWRWQKNNPNGYGD